MVIGGGDVFAAAMARADRLEITHVHAAPEGDSFFPPIDPTVWREDQAPRNAGRAGRQRQFRGRDVSKALKSGKTLQKAALPRVVTTRRVPYNPSQQGQPALHKPAPGDHFNAME